ncbi:DNA-packaging protein [Enterococcus faecalis]|nr:DNA-packaging protein [Enterococcus faecalis]
MIPKFRAYSVEENIMYYPDEDKNVEWTIDDDTGFIAPLINLENGMWGMIDKYVLMQSTGLKDKNGVEIFEGDILKIIELTNEGISEYITDVIWEDCSFVFKSEGVEYYDSFLGAFSGDPNTTYPLFELLVIGNVYENPELLEEAE